MLNELQSKFIDNIFKPEYFDKYKQAAIDAGYSESYSANYGAILSHEEVVKEIVKRLDELLALNGPRCVHGVLDVLTNPGQKGAKAKLDAAWGILDRAGISKKERLEVEHKAASGVFIIPAKKD